jgi:hypothetical protein
LDSQRGFHHLLQLPCAFSRIRFPNTSKETFRLRRQLPAISSAPSVRKALYPVFLEPPFVPEVLRPTEWNSVSLEVFAHRQARLGYAFDNRGDLAQVHLISKR